VHLMSIHANPGNRSENVYTRRGAARTHSP